MYNKFTGLEDDVIINKFIEELKEKMIKLKNNGINNKEEIEAFTYEIADKFKIEILDKLNKEILAFLGNIENFEKVTFDAIRVYFDKKFESGCGIDINIKTEEICKYNFKNLSCKKIGNIIKHMNDYRENSEFNNLSKEAKDAIYSTFDYLENSEFKPKEQTLEDFYKSIVAFLVEIFNSNNDYYLGILQLKYINYENNIKIIEGLLGNLDLDTREEIIRKYDLDFL